MYHVFMLIACPKAKDKGDCFIKGAVKELSAREAIWKTKSDIQAKYFQLLKTYLGTFLTLC